LGVAKAGSFGLRFANPSLFGKPLGEGIQYAVLAVLIERRNPMAATIIAPEVETPVEPPVEKKPVLADEPKPAGWEQRVRDLLVAIFEGHEEFLGWTPD
jgi:hypothetical protein